MTGMTFKPFQYILSFTFNFFDFHFLSQLENTAPMAHSRLF